MVQKKMSQNRFPILEPNLQISFYQRLESLEKAYLHEALRRTVSSIDLAQIDRELVGTVQKQSLGKVASFGIRGEIFFPVPCLVRARPSLLGYYRLLYGFSQKEFYRQRPLSSFKRMEEKNEISNRLDESIPHLRLCLERHRVLPGLCQEPDLRSRRHTAVRHLIGLVRRGHIHQEDRVPPPQHEVEADSDVPMADAGSPVPADRVGLPGTRIPHDAPAAISMSTDGIRYRSRRSSRTEGRQEGLYRPAPMGFDGPTEMLRRARLLRGLHPFRCRHLRSHRLGQELEDETD